LARVIPRLTKTALSVLTYVEHAIARLLTAGDVAHAPDRASCSPAPSLSPSQVTAKSD